MWHLITEMSDIICHNLNTRDVTQLVAHGNNEMWQMNIISDKMKATGCGRCDTIRDTMKTKGYETCETTSDS